MASAKPADFFLGAMEFFGLLVPGAALVFVLKALAPPAWVSLLTQASDAANWCVFLLLSYCAGHLLHATGSYLDKAWYQRLYLPRHAGDHAHTASLRNQLIKAKSPEVELKLRSDARAMTTLVGRVYAELGRADTGTTMYDWCLSLLRAHESAGVAEVDRCQADSKLFRSLALVNPVAGIWAFSEGLPYLGFIAIGLAYGSLKRYGSLRWKATKLTYQYTLILRESEGRAARERAKATAADSRDSQ